MQYHYPESYQSSDNTSVLSNLIMFNINNLLPINFSRVINTLLMTTGYTQQILKDPLVVFFLRLFVYDVVYALRQTVCRFISQNN